MVSTSKTSLERAQEKATASKGSDSDDESEGDANIMGQFLVEIDLPKTSVECEADKAVVHLQPSLQLTTPSINATEKVESPLHSGKTDDDVNNVERTLPSPGNARSKTRDMLQKLRKSQVRGNPSVEGLGETCSSSHSTIES